MSLFGNLLGRLFSSGTAPEPSITGPILGKRKASGSSDQARRRKQPKPAYSESDYANIDLNDGQLTSIDTTRFAFTPRKVRRVNRGTSSKRSSGEGYWGEKQGGLVDAGNLPGIPLTARNFRRIKRATGMKGTPRKRSSDWYLKAFEGFPTAPLTSAKRSKVTTPKDLSFVPSTPKYGRTEEKYTTTSSSTPESGFDDDVAGLVGSDYSDHTPTPYRSPGFDVLHQSPQPWTPGSNDNESHQSSKIPSTPYPFTAKEQGVFDTSVSSTEYESSDEDEEPEPQDTSGHFAAQPAPVSNASATAPDVWTPSASHLSPNARVRQILTGSKSLAGAKTFILNSLRKEGSQKPEPEYAFHDIEIRDGLWWVMDLMERFTTRFFRDGDNGEICKLHTDDKVKCEEELKSIFRLMKPETLKVIGCVASGGPGGHEGWHELFTKDQKRRALINAIIGNVLTEQVFQHTCFGSGTDTQTALKEKERELKNVDGFVRNKAHAEIINSRLVGNNKDNTTFSLPPQFELHTKAVVTAILEHLLPLIKTKSIDQSLVSTSLYDIVSTAGILSLLMRSDPHTVYYFVPIFKEDTFTSKHMECFNRVAMEQNNPRKRQQWPPNTTSEEKKRATADEALIQITIMDGVTAYRQGGWETDVSTPVNPVWAQDGGGADSGVRCRTLTHGWVYCRWGRARRFGKGGVAVDDAKVHGDSWRGDGFVEFGDVPGVPKSKGKAKKKMIKAGTPLVSAMAAGAGATASGT